MSRSRKFDPEPLTIAASLAAVLSAIYGTVELVKRLSPDLPSSTRRTLLNDLSKMEELALHLSEDVELIEGIFSRAEFPGERVMRLGNGALVTLEDFERYQRVADRVFDALKRLNKLSLRIEKVVAKTTWLNPREVAIYRGEATERLERILVSRNLSVDEAWEELRTLVRLYAQMVSALRAQLTGSL